MASKNKKISSEDLIELLTDAPGDGYFVLVTSRWVRFSDDAQEFWDQVNGNDPFFRALPRSISNRIKGLAIFHFGWSAYNRRKDELIEKLIDRAPSEADRLKCFLLMMDFAATNENLGSERRRSEISLQAIKLLMKELKEHFKDCTSNPVSIDEYTILKELLGIQTEILLLEEFQDHFIWSGFYLVTDKPGYKLVHVSTILETQNDWKTQRLKQAVRNDFLDRKSQENISMEPHFRKHDKEWKTNEGFVSIFISKGTTVTAQPSGTTFMEVDEEHFDDNDTLLRSIISKQLIQHFYSNYRQVLGRIYFPYDEIAIHEYTLKTSNGSEISLFELLCGIACIVAKARILSYLHGFCDEKNLTTLITALTNEIKKQQPSIENNELLRRIEYSIARDFEQLQKESMPTDYEPIEKGNLLGWLREVEELKEKTDEQLLGILDILSDVNSSVPFNLLYEINDQYFFDFRSGYIPDTSRMLYDFYASDRLFSNSQDFESQKEVGERQNQREQKFTKSISKVLGMITPHTLAGFEYKLGAGKHEIDAIAYFPEENAVLVIEAKLCNVTPRRERKKWEWVNNHIKEKACKQIRKDLTFLKTRAGQEKLQEKLKIEVDSPTYYKLIVTDNFLADHKWFKLSEEEQVLCVSFFELECLIKNETVDENQEPWEMPGHSTFKPIKTLMQLLEDNVFWRFVNDRSNEIQLKSLTMIDESHRIAMES